MLIHRQVLFYEDPAVFKPLEVKMPIIKDKFPEWSDHASGMSQLAGKPDPYSTSLKTKTDSTDSLDTNGSRRAWLQSAALQSYDRCSCIRTMESTKGMEI